MTTEGPARRDFYITNGDDWSRTITFSGYSLTGATFDCPILTGAGTEVDTINATASSSTELALSLSDTETALLTPGRYSYAVTATKSGTTTTFLAGIITVGAQAQSGQSAGTDTLTVDLAGTPVTLTVAAGITQSAIDTAVATHEADTTAVHGIADTSTLYRSGGTDVAVADGGTGASDAATARTNLGLGSISTQASSNVSITGGSITGITDLAVADGGTGASDQATARTNLGLGSIATQASSNVSITGGSITGITDLAVADGGTGASDAATARTNLGAQAADQDLTDIAGLTRNKGDLIVGGASAWLDLAVGGNGTTVVADSNETTGIKWVGANGTKSPYEVSARGYFMPDTWVTYTVGSQAAGTPQEAYWYPYWLPRRCTPTLSIYCFTLESGSTVRFSTWTNDEATFKPSTIIEDVGTVSGAGTGNKTITCTQPIGPGWVWVGVWVSNHSTVRWARNSSTVMRNRLFGDSGYTVGRAAYGWRATGLDYSAAWGTLPTLSAAIVTTHPNPPTPYMENV